MCVARFVTPLLRQPRSALPVILIPKVATLAQEQLKQVGIIVELQIVEHATYHEHIRKNLNPFVL